MPSSIFSTALDRDGDLLAAPEVALLEEHVRDVSLCRVDDEPLHLADLAVAGVHAARRAARRPRPAGACRGSRPRWPRRAWGRRRPPGRSRASSTPRARRRRRSRCRRGGSRSPRRRGACRTRRGCSGGGRRPAPGLDQVERDEAAQAAAVLGLDHEVGELAGHRVDDDPAHRAAGSVAARGGGPDRERGVCHAGLLVGQDPTGAPSPPGPRRPVAAVTSPAGRRPSARPPRRRRRRAGARGTPRSGRRAPGARGCGRPTRSGAPGTNVRCSSEQNHTSAPSTDGLPWSMPSALRPQSATAQSVDTEITVDRTRERLDEGQAELAVGGVHERVGAGLDLGGPRVEVVGPGAARRDRPRRRPRRRPASAAPWTPRASARACARSSSPTMWPSYPMTPRTVRPAARARSASRPASSGRQPQRGRPTLTSISTSGTPARAAASIVSSESTATVTRAPAPASAPSRVASTTSLASRRSSPRPARAMPSISRMVAQVKPVWPSAGLAGRQRGALVRLHVRPQPVAGQGVGHGAQVGLERGRVDDERRRRELRGLHRRQATDRAGRAATEARVLSAPVSTPWLGDACGLVDAFRAKELSPLEALDDCIAAIEASPLNAFSFTDFDRAREAARRRPTSRCPSAACPSASRSSSRWRAGRTPRPRSSSRTGSPTTTTRRCAACARPGRSWPRRRRRPSSAASTAPRPSCTGRRATRGTSSAPRAARRAARRRRSPAACCRSRRAATAAGPSAARPASAACSA